jgi:hypothetical protein
MLRRPGQLAFIRRYRRVVWKLSVWSKMAVSIRVSPRIRPLGRAARRVGADARMLPVVRDSLYTVSPAYVRGTSTPARDGDDITRTRISAAGGAHHGPAAFAVGSVVTRRIAPRWISRGSRDQMTFAWSTRERDSCDRHGRRNMFSRCGWFGDAAALSFAEPRASRRGASSGRVVGSTGDIRGVVMAVCINVLGRARRDRRGQGACGGHRGRADRREARALSTATRLRRRLAAVVASVAAGVLWS